VKVQRVAVAAVADGTVNYFTSGQSVTNVASVNKVLKRQHRAKRNKGGKLLGISVEPAVDADS